MLARICGRDKRVPGVIKLPGEQQPALQSGTFLREEEESIGQQRPRPFSPSFPLRLRGKLADGRARNEVCFSARQKILCAFIYFPLDETMSLFSLFLSLQN